MNGLYWIVLLALNFLLIIFAFRRWGKTGLYIWMPISVITANIQVTKNVVLFGMEATLGNIIYSGSFLATDILSECYGKKEAGHAVGIGLFSLAAMTVMMQVALWFKPSASDIAGSSMQTIFGLMPRIAVSSLLAYALSNLHDINAFEFWKKKSKALWVRNNFSTLVSQLLDTLIFTLGAFAGVYEASVLVQIMLSTLVLKWITAICDTPFMYLCRKWFNEGKVREISG